MNDGVRRYFELANDARRARLEALHEAILACYPDAVVGMSYRMPTYRHGEG